MSRQTSILSLLSRQLRHFLILIPIMVIAGWQTIPSAQAEPKPTQRLAGAPHQPKGGASSLTQGSDLEPKQPTQPATTASPNNNPDRASSPLTQPPRRIYPTTPPASVTQPFNENVTIPQSSAIVVSFPAELTLDPKRKYNFPITLSLARPIVDAQGNIVVPARSLISARMKAMKGGDLLEADGVIIGGRVIPINAIGAMVPAQTKPEDFANQFVPSPGPVNNVFNSLVLWQTTALNLDPDVDSWLGAGLAILAGITTPRPKDPPPYVSIAQGTLYILTLAAPISVPKQLVETGLQLQQSDNGTDGTDNTAQ